MKYGWITSIRSKGKELFEVIANEQVKINILQAIPFWIASFITGVVAVIYSKLFTYSEGLLQKALIWHAWSIFLLAPLCFLTAWYIVKLFAPNAKGSGIPQVMAALDLSSTKDEDKISGLLSIRILLTKIASSFLMVLGGGAVGREGPTIQIAGSVFRMVNKWIPATWSKLSEKSFILTGAAAGLAAAFNTPLGGIVFAIEELAKVHINYFKTALFAAVIIAGLTAQALLGPYLYLGYPDVKNLSKLVFLGVVATAIVSGILGSFMCKIILRIIRWKKTLNNTKSILYIIATGLIVATIAYTVNTHILGSGKELMNETLFSANKHSPWHTVLLRILGPILSFNVGAAGGIFAPSLAAGAAVGSFLSGMMHVVGANANILILSGMVGFLTGVTRTPFTSAILVLEMTDRHSVIFHLMLAAMVANIVALMIDKHSFYEQLKKGYLDDAKAEPTTPPLSSSPHSPSPSAPPAA